MARGGEDIVPLATNVIFSQCQIFTVVVLGDRVSTLKKLQMLMF